MPSAPTDSAADAQASVQHGAPRRQQDREQADCEYGAGGEQSVSAAHPRDQPCRRYLRYDDEEGVDEDDDTDLTGPDRCMRHRKRREDVGEERAADHHKRDADPQIQTLVFDETRCDPGQRGPRLDYSPG